MQELMIYIQIITKKKLSDAKTKKETDKDNAITKLKNLGLTEDEAKAYIGEE